MEYCRHYFLIGGIILGLVILLIYHLTLGNKKPVFQCVAVNQEIDLNRDSKVSADFADYLGVKADKLGLRKPEEMTEILEGQDRTKAGRLMPPEGLTLESVEY